MKEIQLSQGKVALVDDEDYKWLNQWRWCAVKSRETFCASRGVRRDGKWSSERMHRLILRPLEYELVDHKDHNGLNNQKENLRLCTNGQNQMNRHPASATGFKGVYRDRSGRYKASIDFENKRYRLGTYDTPDEAALVYNKAAKKYHKEFANLNNV
jgi:hypothetical protein